MKKSISIGIIFSYLFINISCATIMKDKMDLISFSSEPDGAKIHVDNYPVAETPASVPLERTKHSINFKKEGYQTGTAIIDRRLDWGWYIFGNIVFGGIVGWIVDALTNEMWNLEPKRVHVVLEKK
ncbi:MAG: hypothetical protein A3G93_00435 [Nitrospinae bacterium RIFCSPLOWO2_12_FULL_45_22]|nr:MAG: hypothetical protein A3G93_00435 [Nitrospinae bacterium RIFCSPLOWO2_12_FULL_45_22]